MAAYKDNSQLVSEHTLGIEPEPRSSAFGLFFDPGGLPLLLPLGVGL